MTKEEPPTKKQKKSAADWAGHTMNINNAVMKVDEGLNFTDIASMSIRALEGIGPKADHVLEALKIKTVKDLANYKYFTIARAIQTLAATEVAGKRPKGSYMNIDKALDKEYETKSLKELVKAPLSALHGLTTEASALLKELGVKNIGDLGNLKYCRWAEAIVELANHEELLTTEQRKVERELHKLE